MDTSSWIAFALPAAGAAAVVWLLARWQFARRLAALRDEAVRLERERQHGMQQQLGAMQHQIERLQRELATTAARAAARHVPPPAGNDATATTREERLARAEAAFAAAEAAAPRRPPTPDTGFPDTEPMTLPPGR